MHVHEDRAGAIRRLLAAVAFLLVAWSFVVPVFESPDEPSHWQYARYVHDHRQLPPYERGFDEANSPPLYYLLVAPFAVPSDTPRFLVTTRPDGGVVSLAPPRWTLNTDRDLSRYWSIRLARLATAALSVATVWVCYRIGLAATGRVATGLLVAMIVGLLPQFTFRGMNVSNDALLTLCAAGVMLGVVQLLREGFTWRVGLRTSVLLAAAYLSKISAIALLVPVTFALVRPPGRWPARLGRLTVLGVALAIVFPWSLRNVLLYGDPFASAAMRDAVHFLISDRSLLSPYFLDPFPRLLAASFVGTFGWMNVWLPTWVYLAFALGAGLAVAGLARGVARGTVPRALVLALVLTVVAVLGVVVRINLTFTQPQGRYMFPALPALALLAALGLESLPARMRVLARPALVGTALVAANVYALLAVVRPAYYPAPARDLGPSARLLHATSVTDLVPLDGAREFTINGPDPAWTLPADVDALSYGAVDIELAAAWAEAPREGCLYFTGPDGPPGADRRVCFRWRADGTTQRLHVPVAPHPAWRDRIAALRIDPVEAGADVLRGATVRLGRVRLVAASGEAG